ncbi:MAG: CvpA family protein [Clostridium sp.]|nr:CvpA family protein [Clostridium sp.]
MNWIDLVVIIIIVGLGVVGLKKGLVYSLFKLVSFFISAIIAVKLYPLISKILSGTKLFSIIKSGIFNKLMVEQQTSSPGLGSSAKVTAQSIIEGLKLPGFAKGMLESNIAQKIPDVTELISITEVMDSISDLLAGAVIDILALIVVFILIKIGLNFAERILKGITVLPLIKQVDKVGGLAFGALQGILIVYIVFVVMMAFSALPQFSGILNAIESSKVARTFYQNNFIINWMFPQNVVAYCIPLSNSPFDMFAFAKAWIGLG